MEKIVEDTSRRKFMAYGGLAIGSIAVGSLVGLGTYAVVKDDEEESHELSKDSDYNNDGSLTVKFVESKFYSVGDGSTKEIDPKSFSYEPGSQLRFDYYYDTAVEKDKDAKFTFSLDEFKKALGSDEDLKNVKILPLFYNGFQNTVSSTDSNSYFIVSESKASEDDLSSKDSLDGKGDFALSLVVTISHDVDRKILDSLDFVEASQKSPEIEPISPDPSDSGK